MVLLGASNLTMGWRFLVSALRAGLSGRLQIFTAGGMGRSYLGRSRFAYRALPGILECGLWSALQSGTAEPGIPVALITDLGNDLVYGSSPEQIRTAAQECVQRLRQLHPETDIVITRPPLSSVQSLSPLRFAVFRRLLFPRCGLTLPQIQSATAKLDQCVTDLAQQYTLPVITPSPDWYGLDPIHVRRSRRVDAFCRMAAGWTAWNQDDPRQPLRVTAAALPIPHQQIRFGREYTTQQPSRQYPDAVVHAF